MSVETSEARSSEFGLPIGWNRTTTDYERESTIHSVFEKRAAEDPEALAIEEGQRSVTYGELDALAHDVAERLRPYLNGTDQIVGVLADRSIETVVAFLGILKAGAAYVPLEADQPAEWLRFMLDDTGARVVLAPRAWVDVAIDVARVDVLCVEGDGGRSDDAVPRSDEQSWSGSGPTSLAYVMYTSGSSGRPKGVAIEHRGVLRYVRGAHDIIPRRDDRVLHVGQIGFDPSTYEIWGTLCNGGCLVVHPGGRFDPQSVDRTVVDHGVTIAMFSTGALHLMIDGALASLGGCRMVFATGDVLSPSHARRLRAAHPQVRLLNAYGPTEITVTASVYEVRDIAPGHSVPIGRPLANTQLYVVDVEGHPVRAGDSGELLVGGDGVARGYLARPELTAEKFVPDRFTSTPGGCLYRTGDLVRLLPGGDLEFLGRIDNQLKIRGYRVEPAEVAATLSGHPAVEVAEVMVRQDVRGRKQLVAYVIATYDIDSQRLRRYLRRRLPDYMVPSHVVMVSEMPQTANGKMDRAALAALENTADRLPLSTITEEAVARHWAAVLGSDDVMASDDFFDAGGDSLLALQLLTTIRGELGVELPLSAVFDERTVRSLAGRIDAERIIAADGDSSWLRLAPLVACDPMAEVAASVAQSQVGFLSELADQSLPYQSSSRVDFNGHLDETVLVQSLQSVVDRHDILRTRFPKVRGMWIQEVQPQWRVELPVVDLRAAPDPDAALAALQVDLLGERIELTELPLVRWTLVRVSDECATLFQVEHHVVHDGWSSAKLVGEIVTLYRAYAAGLANPLPTPSLQYVDFAQWQRSLSRTDIGRRQLDYWRLTLTGIPRAPALVTDRLAPVERNYAGASLRRDLSAELIDRIHRFASRSRCTPYMVMLGAFHILLSRLSGETDVVVGSGLANRRLPGSESLLGMFVNTVVMRVDLSGDPTIDEALVRVRAAALGALDNQELPFEEVVRALAPQRQAGRNPLYDHLFSFHDSPVVDLRLDGVSVDVSDALSNGSAKADLNVIVINQRGRSASAERPDGKELTVVWEYATDIFDPSTGAQLLTSYLHLLDQLVSDTGQRLSDLELTTADERVQLVAGDAHPMAYERDQNIDEVFASRVRENPDGVAVVVGSRQLTYDELDRASNNVVAGIVARGFEAGDRVGVVDDRSLAMVVTLLGVVKAGGVYVGLDRTWPSIRVARVVADAGVRLVCTTSPGQQFDGVDVVVVEVDADGNCDSPAATVAGLMPSSTRRRTATDAAYISFTSGSTGEPKGVIVAHRGVVRLVRGTDYITLGSLDVVLGLAPLAFDASTFEIWGALLNGARLILTAAGPLSTAEIADILRENGVTTAFFTAAIFHQMVEYQLDTIASLHQILAGGDVLSPTHVNRLLQALEPPSVLINGYGPTEGTTFSCCYRMAARTRVDGPVPLGRPIAHSTAVVVDSSGRLTPNGLAGELWIGGDGIAIGYVGRPQLTQERFVVNPFGGQLGVRLYRTGDRVRRSEDGQLTFLGRTDRQVKIRGYRVEPFETEAALLRHAAIAQAHVVPVEYGRDDKRLVAYLVAAPDTIGEPIGDVALRGFLGSVVPAYMIPVTYVWLASLPLHANGKVNPQRLPAPPSTWFPERRGVGSDTPTRYAARSIEGATPAEDSLVAIWQEVMGIRDIGLYDDFFDLGGHSLLAVELFAAIERTTGVRLRLATIFEAPTVASMATVLRAGGWGTAIGSLVALTKTGTRPPLFAVTAGDGNAVGFGPLARRLGPDQPFYVLQPHGLDSPAPLHRSVESMARHYVRKIRAVQPAGPYLLAGRCFGALVAYEMARRLEAAGEEVALLASIDSGGAFRWSERRLANGMVYDTTMNEARVRGLEDGVEFGDLFSDRAAADAFVRWIGANVSEHDGVSISRYIHTAYLMRPDVRMSYPLKPEDDGWAGHAGLLHWAWVSGRREMGLQAALLAPPPSEVRRSRQINASHGRSLGQRSTARLLDWVNFATRGSIRSLANRRRDEILRLAADNVVRYRAGPLKATVSLFRASQESASHQQMQFTRWFGLDVGGLVFFEVPAPHEGMLREPAVAVLAQRLEQCISYALGGAAGARSVD